MENKNFEKKQYHDAEHGNVIPWVDGYNTCLDRTNAKGIYDKAQALCKRIDHLENMLVPVEIPESVSRLKEELQTELKKAES